MRVVVPNYSAVPGRLRGKRNQNVPPAWVESNNRVYTAFPRGRSIRVGLLLLAALGGAGVRRTRLYLVVFSHRLGGEVNESVARAAKARIYLRMPSKRLSIFGFSWDGSESKIFSFPI